MTAPGVPYRGKAATEASRDDWQTPPAFLAGLRQRWRFVLDAACDATNAVASTGITADVDGLATDWLPDNGVETVCWPEVEGTGRLAAWCNPPFGRKGAEVRRFIARAAQQARQVCGPAGLDVVVLAPGTPGVAWMHDVVLAGARPADEVWFSRSRLAFVHPVTGLPVRNNPVSSTLLVWRAGWRRPGPPFVGSIGRDGLPPGGWEGGA